MHISPDTDLLSGAIGGSVLGLSVSMYMYSTGNMTGCSSILNGLLERSRSKWKMAYLHGMLSSGVLFLAFYPQAFGVAAVTLKVPALIAGGMMIGFGTRLGSGCTSGHGLCGLSRQSPRSLAAVLTFMTTGALTAYVANLPSIAAHLYTSTSTSTSTSSAVPTGMKILWHAAAATATLAVAKAVQGYRRSSQSTSTGGASERKGSAKSTNTPMSTSSKGSSSSSSLHTPTWTEYLFSYASGLLFGAGLGISGMANPAKVVGFLNFTGAQGWDPTLMAVLGCGVVVTTACFHYLCCRECDITLNKEKKHRDVIRRGRHPANMRFTWELFAGSALFGCGWGLSGFCPGPAVVSFAGLMPGSLVILPSIFAGMLLKDYVFGV